MPTMAYLLLFLACLAPSSAVVVDDDANVYDKVNQEAEEVLKTKVSVTPYESAYFHHRRPVSLYNHLYENIVSDETPSSTTTTAKVMNKIPLFPHLVEPFKSFPCTPRQVHLSLGDENKEEAASSASMRISFSVPHEHKTKQKPYKCHPDNTVVRIYYGPMDDEEEKGNKQHEQIIAVDDDITQYNATNLHGKFYMSDWLYHVQITNLDFDTKYWYQIQVLDGGVDDNGEEDQQQQIETSQRKTRHRNLRSGIIGQGLEKDYDAKPKTFASKLGETPEYTFTTAPSPTRSFSENNKSTKIIIFGDLGQSYNSTETMNNILTTELIPTSSSSHLMICAGDMSYANARQHKWDNWFDLMEPLTRIAPLHVLPGNHEVECDYGVNRDIFSAYEHRFRMPNRVGDAITLPMDPKYYNGSWYDDGEYYSKCADNSKASSTYNQGNAYYAFTYGSVHIISLNTYTNSSVSSPQYTFLEQELQSIDRRVTPWILVLMHGPIYNTFEDHQGESPTLTMRETMEPLFVQYQVNLVISGHVHAYMRTKSVSFDVVDTTGKSPVYLIVGEGGNSEGHADGFLSEEKEDWVELRDKSVFGFGTLEVYDDRRARWKWIMDVDDNQGKVQYNKEKPYFTDDFTLENGYFL